MSFFPEQLSDCGGATQYGEDWEPGSVRLQSLAQGKQPLSILARLPVSVLALSSSSPVSKGGLCISSPLWLQVGWQHLWKLLGDMRKGVWPKECEWQVDQRDCLLFLL